LSPPPPGALGSAGAVSVPPEYAYVVNVRSATLQRTSMSVALELSFPWERISNKMCAFYDTQFNLNITAKEGTEVRKGPREWKSGIYELMQVQANEVPAVCQCGTELSGVPVGFVLQH